MADGNAPAPPVVVVARFGVHDGELVLERHTASTGADWYKLARLRAQPDGSLRAGSWVAVPRGVAMALGAALTGERRERDGGLAPMAPLPALSSDAAADAAADAIVARGGPALLAFHAADPAGSLAAYARVIRRRLAAREGGASR